MNKTYHRRTFFIIIPKKFQKLYSVKISSVQTISLYDVNKKMAKGASGFHNFICVSTLTKAIRWRLQFTHEFKKNTFCHLNIDTLQTNCLRSVFIIYSFMDTIVVKSKTYLCTCTQHVLKIFKKNRWPMKPQVHLDQNQFNITFDSHFKYDPF